MDVTMEGYENLANQIVLTAVEDYRKARVVLKSKYGDKGKAQDTIDEVTRFFKSKWFTELTSVDPIALIEKLERE